MPINNSLTANKLTNNSLINGQNHHHMNHNNHNSNMSSFSNENDTFLINLCEDFFNSQFELKKAPIPFPSSASKSTNTTSLSSTTTTINNYKKICMALRALGKSFEELYEEKLYDMINKLDLNKNNAYETFSCLSDEIFSEGIKWNHIVTYLVFSADFAYYANMKLASTTNDVKNWLIKYMKEKLTPWIEKNGGWDGIIKFAEETIGKIPENDDSLIRMNVKNVLCGVAGAFGVLSLGFFLSSK